MNDLYNPPIRGVLDAWPNTPQVYTSPIAGDPDTTAQESICGIQHIATGFLLPKAGGIVSEIGMVAQGNVGAGVNRNIRWSVVDIERNPSTPTGLQHKETLQEGVTPVADNATGFVTLATGLSLEVPSQFVVAIKGAFQSGSTEVRVQNCMSAGPLPGVIGTVFAPSTTLISAATYTFQSVDFDAVNPPSIPLNDGLQLTSYKALSLYIKWQGE